MISVSLEHKTTLVIGGSRGIGAAIVKTAAKAGSNVVWTCQHCKAGSSPSTALQSELNELGVSSFFRQIDCTDERSTHALVDEVLEKYGKIDHLVHCAGYTSPVSMLEISAGEWRHVVDINLNSAFISVRSVIGPMIRSGGGVILLIGSAAIYSGGGGRADYVSGKSGLEGLNRAVTKEFAPSGIRCNVIHPSLIKTDLLKKRHPDARKRQKLAGNVPLGRLGNPEDISYPAVFLLSELAGYITGQSIIVDGGRTFCR